MKFSNNLIQIEDKESLYAHTHYIVRARSNEATTSMVEPPSSAGALAMEEGTPSEGFLVAKVLKR